jgi:predicted AAA+ superfamily ATPase
MLRSLKEQHIIKVVTGMRRSGKSTLLEMLAVEIRQTVTEEQIQFYNFEDLETLAIGDFMQVHRHVTERLVANKMNYIFLDEVQNIANFERMVDSLYIKKNVDLYITGSNAYLLSSELATLLTGRYIEINILPFSFAEYYAAVALPKLSKNESLAEPPNSPKYPEFGSLGNLRKVFHSTIDMAKNVNLVNFLIGGGIPQAVELYQFVGSADDFLGGVLNTIIEKDIFKRNEIYNRATFNKIVDFMMDSIGSLTSFRSISGILKNEGIAIDHKTVSQYLDYLSSAFLFYKVPRYDVKGKNLLRTLDKYYLSDTGLRKVRLQKNADADMGHLLENAAYLELRRRYRNVFVGKWNEYEIDFVAIDREGYASYFQVAFSTHDTATLERELRPLLAIRDSNPKYLLTTDWDTNPVYDGIRKLNVADWLLNDA